MYCEGYKMLECLESRKTLEEIAKLNKCLNVPAYQRGYRWSTLNVEQLIDDNKD